METEQRYYNDDFLETNLHQFVEDEGHFESGKKRRKKAEAQKPPVPWPMAKNWSRHKKFSKWIY